MTYQDHYHYKVVITILRCSCDMNSAWWSFMAELMANLTRPSSEVIFTELDLSQVWINGKRG